MTCFLIAAPLIELSTHHGHGGASTTSIMSTSVAIPSCSSYTRSYEACFGENSSISKSDVVYVEMHATGTVRGDEAELDSIVKFYCDGRDQEGPRVLDHPLWLGGNKSTLGHTEPVSGLISVAKILLAFDRGHMPATVLMSDPSHALQDMAAFNVHLTTAPLRMAALQKGLFCATSSGMSGTTSHVVLRPPNPCDRAHGAETTLLQLNHRPHLLIMHSHSQEAAVKWRGQFSDKWSNVSLNQDYTFPNDGLLHRFQTPVAVVTLAAFEDHKLLAGLSLNELPPIINPPTTVSKGNGKAAVVLAFGGVGLVQYGVARRAYLQWPAFRNAVEHIE